MSWLRLALLGSDNMSAITIRHTGVSRGGTHTFIMTLYWVTITRKHLIHNMDIDALRRLCTRLQKHKGPEGIQAN